MENKLVSVIPSLTLNNPLIKDRSSKLAYILRHAMNSPGWTSSQIEGELVSMRKMEALHGPQVQDVAAAIQQNIQHVIAYHEKNATVTVRPELIDGVKYRFVISVEDSITNEPLILLHTVRTDQGEFILVNTEIQEGEEQ